MPFDIPDNWMWIKVKEIFDIRNGFTPLRTETKYWENGDINWFTVEDIRNQGRLISTTVQKINHIACTKDRIVPANSLLLCCTASIGEYALTKINLTTNQQFNALTHKNYMTKLFNMNFILSIASTLKKRLTELAGKTTFAFVSTKKLGEIMLPLPPLEEQQRIIDKINSFEPLLEKYDKVEKELSKLEKEFPEKLKKSILQYAIEGKLVKQDPNDEPASVLLERIKQEKERLIKEGKIKRDKNESYIYQGDDKNYYKNINDVFILKEVPYAVHTSWFWSELGQVVNIINGFTPSRSNSDFWKDGTIPWMTVEDLNIQGDFFSSTIQRITHKALKSTERIIPKNSTFICCTSATIGRTAINLIPATSNQQFNGLVIKEHILNYLDNNYLFIFCKTLKHKLIEMAGITTFPFVSVEKLSKILIPIPPLKEQIKIVNKINKLEIFLE